jgi:hypothetical protein
MAGLAAEFVPVHGEHHGPGQQRSAMRGHRTRPWVLSACHALNMTDTNSGSDPKASTSPGASSTANFSRHDVDVNAPDDARGGHEQASFDRHDIDPAAPDSVHEEEQATFDRHDVNAAGPDSVDEEDEATYDRHDTTS